MESLFPLNPSLADELQRLFTGNNPFYDQQFIETSVDDFRQNGVDREYCPELEGSSWLNAAISPYSNQYLQHSPLANSFSNCSYFHPPSSLSPIPSAMTSSPPSIGGIPQQFSSFSPQRRSFGSGGGNTSARSEGRPGTRRRNHTECVFCRNNGEPNTWFRNHSLRDATGRVTCPVLRAYTCPICGTSGDTAHTIKYCPRNRSTELALNSMGLLNGTGTSAESASSSLIRRRRKLQ